MGKAGEVTAQLSAFLMVRDGSLIIGDPCYMPTAKDRKHGSGFDPDLFEKIVYRVKVPIGHYPIYSVSVSAGLLGVMMVNRVSLPKNLDYEGFKDMIRGCTESAEIGNDSGQMGLLSEEVIFNWNDDDIDTLHYGVGDDVARVSRSRVFATRIGRLGATPVSDAVIFNTYSDGTFPILMCFDENNNFKHLFVPTLIALQD